MKQSVDTTPTPGPLLEFEDATVVLGANTALDSVSFRIDIGENVAIIGPNGSGKSTLIKAITRECYPLARDSGSPVRILGEHTWNVFSLRSMLGIVSTDLQESCSRDISGRHMVLSGFFGSIGIYPYHRITPEMEEKAAEVAAFMEASHLVDKSMLEMSTGEARRILIARALVHDPQALILDEPMNGLDPHAARKFLESLRKIARARKSIVMVTHHLQDIIPETGRVIMLRQGKVFRDGAKEDVLTQANLSKLFDMPVEIQRRDGYYYLWG